MNVQAGISRSAEYAAICYALDVKSQIIVQVT